MTDRKLELRIWETKLYYLQCEAPKPNVIPCCRHLNSKPHQYGLEYHGAISRQETETLLENASSGSYLIRNSQRAELSYTLVIQFDGVAKNYMLFYDDIDKQHYVGERRFDNIELLVADGLIHLYIETRGADVLKRIAEANIYEKTPFYRMRYHTFNPSIPEFTLPATLANSVSLGNARRKTDVISINRHKPLRKQLPQNGTPVAAVAVQQRRKSSDTISFKPSSLHPLSTTVEQPTFHSVSPPPRFQTPRTYRDPLPQSEKQRHISDESVAGQHAPALKKISNDSLTRLPTTAHQSAKNVTTSSPCSPPASPASSKHVTVNQQSLVISQTTDALSPNYASRRDSPNFITTPNSSLSSVGSSGARRSIDNVTTKSGMQHLQERYNLPAACLPDEVNNLTDSKPHNFKVHTYRGPHWCDYCTHFIWGLVAQGVMCADCGFQAHKRCSDRVPCDCLPDIKFLKRVFGVDLTSLTRAERKSVPTLLIRCVDELERRNSLIHEGLYRVCGNHDRVEDLRAAFDKDAESADISESRVPDPNILTSLIKSYLRQLPIPLITYEACPDLIEVMRDDKRSANDKLRDVAVIIAKLPTAHYESLGFFTAHLNRVAEHHQTNMMPVDNLAIVLSPTLMISSYSDPLSCLEGSRYEHALLNLLIRKHDVVFPAPIATDRIILPGVDKPTASNGTHDPVVFPLVVRRSQQQQLAPSVLQPRQQQETTNELDKKRRFLRNRRSVDTPLFASAASKFALFKTKDARNSPMDAAL